MQGARVSTKVYNYPNDQTTHHLFYGIDARYRETTESGSGSHEERSKTEMHTDLLAYYLQGAYVLPIKTKFFDYMQPALRWMPSMTPRAMMVLM